MFLYSEVVLEKISSVAPAAKFIVVAFLSGWRREEGMN